MPKLETWPNFPRALQGHLIERMRERNISIEDLNRLRVWIESRPEVPHGRWYKKFGSFTLCGTGPYPKTFLLREQAAQGEEL